MLHANKNLSNYISEEWVSRNSVLSFSYHDGPISGICEFWPISISEMSTYTPMYLKYDLWNKIGGTVIFDGDGLWPVSDDFRLYTFIVFDPTQDQIAIIKANTKHDSSDLYFNGGEFGEINAINLIKDIKGE